MYGTIYEIQLYTSLLTGYLYTITMYKNLNEYDFIIGRLLNRMTKDIGVIDEQLPQSFFDTMEVSKRKSRIVVLSRMRLNDYYLRFCTKFTIN